MFLLTKTVFGSRTRFSIQLAMTTGVALLGGVCGTCCEKSAVPLAVVLGIMELMQTMDAVGD